jgi:hypothetical protein
VTPATEEKLGLLRQLISRLQHPGLHPAEQILRPERLASVRERDDDALPRTDQRRELALCLGEPARGDRGPLRLERERLRLRERVELGRARERGRIEDPVLLPDLANVVGLKDEVGWVAERRHEVVGNVDGRLRGLVVRELWLDEVEPALCRRVQRRLGNRMKRALGEGREGAYRLDLVPEELHAQRLAARRREDVDDAASNRELTAVVDALDTLVAGESERFPDPVDAELEARAQLDRLGPRFRRRQPLGKGARRRTDEPAALEDVESPRPLADEVRRRREPRLPGDAATGQQPNRVAAEEPGGALRGVACVRVLGQEDHQTSLQPLVQRGEQQRQRGLRHAHARGQGVRELGETLVLDELLDESVEYRTVHDEGRNCRSARVMVFMEACAGTSRRSTTSSLSRPRTRSVPPPSSTCAR